MSKDSKHTLIITDWVNGRLTVEQLFIDTFQDSLTESMKYTGEIKIYNEHDEIVHSEKRERKKHHDHDDDDDHDHHHQYA